jgi:hypothetical protein
MLGNCDQEAQQKNPGDRCGDTTPDDCFRPECDANAMCNQDAEQRDPGAACGDKTSTECDLSDTCSVAGECEENLVAQGTVCTDVAPANCFESQCDGAGLCDLEAAPEPCPVPVASDSGVLTLMAVLGFAAWRTLQPSARR